MRAVKLLCYALVLLLSLPLSAYAPEQAAIDNKDVRNIYIGDIIKLNIAAKGYSEESIKECFSDFEIVDLSEDTDGFLLSLRTLVPGEYTVSVGDKKIVISVLSTLDDIQRDDIFSGAAQVFAAGFFFPGKIISYIMIAVFTILGGIFLLKIVWQRKAKIAEPYQLFLERTGTLLAEHDNYFVDLTRYFKEYIECVYNCRIKGKTSSEIIIELTEMPSLAAMLAEIKQWLGECDRLKFTGLQITNEHKQQHYIKLLELVERIDLQRIDLQKEGASV